MKLFTIINRTLSDRKAKKERRANMSFNASSGSGPAEHVRPESPGARVAGASGSGLGGVG